MVIICWSEDIGGDDGEDVDDGGDGDNGDDGGDGDGAPCCSQLDWFGSNDGLEARL